MASTPYFSDTESGPAPRTVEIINEGSWAAIHSVIEQYMNARAFGADFPVACDDNAGFTIHNDGTAPGLVDTGG
ncbi:MAG: hypothetical protein JWM90_38 [Thermoleophilia bacterium]|nr:hypothetical protein [Thermoleophilia bacterium]